MVLKTQSITHSIALAALILLFSLMPFGNVSAQSNDCDTEKATLPTAFNSFINAYTEYLKQSIKKMQVDEKESTKNAV